MYVVKDINNHSIKRVHVVYYNYTSMKGRTHFNSFHSCSFNLSACLFKCFNKQHKITLAFNTDSLLPHKIPWQHN